MHTTLKRVYSHHPYRLINFSPGRERMDSGRSDANPRHPAPTSPPHDGLPVQTRQSRRTRRDATTASSARFPHFRPVLVACSQWIKLENLDEKVRILLS